MSCTVYQPGEIQIEDITQNALRIKRPEKCFAPEVHRYNRWHDETKYQFQRNEVSATTINTVKTADLYSLGEFFCLTSDGIVRRDHSKCRTYPAYGPFVPLPDACSSSASRRVRKRIHDSNRADRQQFRRIYDVPDDLAPNRTVYFGQIARSITSE